MFKRKIYGKVQAWKRESNGRTALLIGGACKIEQHRLCRIADCLIVDHFSSVNLTDFVTLSLKK